MRDDAAPHVDARPARRAFVRIELLADRGVDAVAADRDAAARVGSGAPRGSRKRARTAAAGVVDADAGVAGDDAIAAEPLAHRREQHRLQVAAVDRELRRVVAGPASARLDVDQLAEAVEEGRLARHDRDALERVANAERRQRRASHAAAR